MSTVPGRQLMSLYVTLLMSVACLGYAELGQNLPETPFFYLCMFVALGVAYWAEGKYTLSIFASNALAAVVLLVGVSWLIFKMESPANEYEAGYNIIRSMVSRTGPILCSLLLAKLFRPKLGSDQWLLQLLGLVQVILASVLAMSSRMDRDAPLFPVLMLLYLFSLAWSFRLFYLRYEVESTPLAPSAAPLATSLHWWSLKPVGWFILCFLLAVVIFFCLPQGGLDASLFQGVDHFETGNTSNIDLNAEGTVQVSDEQVMRIWATDKSGPVSLPDNLRLRGAILSVYEKNGVWQPFPASAIMPQQLPAKPSTLGDNAVRMQYDIDVARIQELGKPRQSRHSTDYNIPLFLADPPTRFLSQYFSMAPIGNMRAPLNANVFEGQTWISLARKTPSITVTHDYTGKINATEWQQVFRELPTDSFQYLRLLQKVPPRIASSGKVLQLSQAVLDQLVTQKLGPNATDREKTIAIANLSDKEKALALERHLSSKEYSYSLDRRKQDTSIDPTEDFLFNVKEGHCERYASALTMLLRTQGIKARIIIGYRGAEWNQMGGFYIVRQLHAHAWVEALIGNDEMADGTKRLTWLVLDATPLNEARSTESSFTSPLSFARFLWEFFILDFAGQAQRTKLLAQIQHTWLGKLINWYSSLEVWQAVLVAIVFVSFLIGIIWLLLRWRRIRRERRYAQKSFTLITVPFYSRLLKLLAAHGWRPTASQTAVEFASVVGQGLKKDQQNAGIAEIPSALVPPYYEVRFGGKKLTQQQESHVDEQLQQLQQSL